MRKADGQVIGVSGDFDAGSDGADRAVGKDHAETGQYLLKFPVIEEWLNAIYANIVVKCGGRRYWDTRAKDVATIAARQVTRLKNFWKQKMAHGMLLMSL